MDFYDFEEQEEEKTYGIRRDYDDENEEENYNVDINETDDLDMSGTGEPRYEKEIKAFERVSKNSKLYELISDPKNLTKKDRFLLKVHKISKYFDDKKILEISENDINIMLEKTQKIIDLEYKNPTAYILGYIGSKAGKELETNIIQNIINNVLPKIKNSGIEETKDSGVEPPDFIRYCRFWRKFL